MLTPPDQLLRFLLQLGFKPEEVTQTVVDVFALPREAVEPAVLGMARRCQEEDIEFAHTVIEHEVAIAAEWRE